MSGISRVTVRLGWPEASWEISEAQNPKTNPASSPGQTLRVRGRAGIKVAQAEAGGGRISVRLNAAIGPAVAVIGHMSSDTVGVVVAQARLTPAGAMIWCVNNGLSP